MNKLVNQKTFFPCWHAYNKAGQYVGRIEKDQYGCWAVYNHKGRRFAVWSYQEAREEAQLLTIDQL